MPRVTLDAPWLGSLTDTGLSPVSPRLSMRCSPCTLRRDGGPNPGRAVTRPVWARPSSIASTKGFTFCFLFLRLLRCFSSPGSPRLSGSAVARTGLPHSEILGSMVICTSPGLFAACRVFRRLLKPRHPPSALVHFLCNVFLLLVGTPVFTPCVDVALVLFTNFVQSCQRSFAALCCGSVENIRVELMTPCLQGRCSSQLS